MCGGIASWCFACLRHFSVVLLVAWFVIEVIRCWVFVGVGCWFYWVVAVLKVINLGARET